MGESLCISLDLTVQPLDNVLSIVTSQLSCDCFWPDTYPSSLPENGCLYRRKVWVTKGVMVTLCVNTVFLGRPKIRIPVDLENHLSPPVTILANICICELCST